MTHNNHGLNLLHGIKANAYNNQQCSSTKVYTLKMSCGRNKCWKNGYQCKE